MKQSDVGYALHRFNDRQYKRLEVCVLTLWGHSIKHVATIRFQSCTEFDNWYGSHIELESCSELEGMKIATDAVSKIVGSTDGYYEVCADNLRDRLRKFNRYVYDSRQHEYVKIADVLPDDVYRYVDGHEGVQCTVSCYAKTSAEAQALLAKEFVSSGHDNKLASWLSDGKPVRRAVHENPPEILSDDEAFAI